MLCSELHCQKKYRLKPFLYKISEQWVVLSAQSLRVDIGTPPTKTVLRVVNSLQHATQAWSETTQGHLACKKLPPHHRNTKGA